jgi:DNA-binding HxlR family transcriptional regulator
MSPTQRNWPEICDRSNCAAIRETLDRVGDKWSLYIITTLDDGPLRFSDIRRRVNGISQRMLTLTLRSLERDGLLLRTQHPEIPPRVEYELTELGRSLLPAVMGLLAWALGSQERIERARAAHDQAGARETG